MQLLSIILNFAGVLAQEIPGTVTAANRAANCTTASQTLVDDYVNCFNLYPAEASSVAEADTRAVNFVRCICDSRWKAGSREQLASSVPNCPAIQGITKGGQASVAADCAGQSQRKVIQNFQLSTKVQNIVYVPLAGLPPGLLSSAKTPSIVGKMATLLLLIII